MCYSRCPLFRGSKGRRSTWLVVIFDEANQFSLIGRIGTEVQANAFCAFMLEAIVESFVVAEVESELLQLPLQVPTRLCDKEEIGMCACLTGAR